MAFDWGAMANAINDLQFGIWNGVLNTSNYFQNQRTHQDNINLALGQLDLANRQYYSNVDIMNKNFGLQQAAFDYNKKQAELTRMREDNAFQRRVADTVAAGFSPLATEGVASSSQAPALTAPQLDPQGVNEATRNRISAYDKMIEINQNKLQQSNFNSELRLKNMQLHLAQIDTAKAIFDSVIDAKKSNQEIRRLRLENEHYEKYGFKDTTLQTLLGSILKNINVNGKTPGEAIADSINEILNSPDESPTDVVGRKFNNFGNDIRLKNLQNDDKVKKFMDILEDTKKGYLSYWDIRRAVDYARFNFGFDLGLKHDRMKSLTDEEFKDILDRFIKYRSSVVGGGR